MVRVGHEGKPDDATDSESDDDKVPHVTLSVDSYYDEPNSIIKYGKYLLYSFAYFILSSIFNILVFIFIYRQWS